MTTGDSHRNTLYSGWDPNALHGTQTEMIRVVALAGGQNRSSISRGLLAAARQLQPPGMEITTLDLEAVPFFDEELELRGDPLPVRRLKRTVSEADGLLIATGEHNGSVPAILKNAIDWISRPYLSSPVSGKPCALVGATYGLDGARSGALRHLREILVKADAAPLAAHLRIERVHRRISDSGVILDPSTSKQIQALLLDLSAAICSDEPLPPNPSPAARSRLCLLSPCATP